MLRQRIQNLINHIHLAVQKELFPLAKIIENLEEKMIENIKFSVFSDENLSHPFLQNKEILLHNYFHQRVDAIISHEEIIQTHHLILKTLKDFPLIQSDDCFLSSSMIDYLSKQKNSYSFVVSDYHACESSIYIKPTHLHKKLINDEHIFPVLCPFDKLLNDSSEKNILLLQYPEIHDLYDEFRYQLLQYLYPNYENIFLQIGGHYSFIQNNFQPCLLQINHEMFNHNSTYIVLENESLSLKIDCFQ